MRLLSAVAVSTLAIFIGTAAAQVILRPPGAPRPTLQRSAGQVPRDAPDPDAPYDLTIRLYLTPHDATKTLLPGQGADLIVTDPNGRRFGQDPYEKTFYREIPGGALEPVINTQPNQPIGPRGLFGSGVRIRQPVEGRYALQVIGREWANYEYVLQAWDRTGRARWTHMGRGGTEPGGIDAYEINFSTALNPPIWITEQRDNSYLTVHLFSDAASGDQLVSEALLTDPRGRRLGFSAADRRRYAEIPRAIYGDGTSDTPAREIEVPAPLPGTHVIEVAGTRRGRYTLEISGSDRTDASGHALVENVPTLAGARHRYRLAVGGSPDAPIVLTGAFGGALLRYAWPIEPTTRVPVAQATVPLVLFYDAALEPTTFRAMFNAADITTRFTPKPGTHQVVILPLSPGMNTLVLSGQGRAGATTIDRLIVERGSAAR